MAEISIVKYCLLFYKNIKNKQYYSKISTLYHEVQVNFARKTCQIFHSKLIYIGSLVIEFLNYLITSAISSSSMWKFFPPFLLLEPYSSSESSPFLLELFLCELAFSLYRLSSWSSSSSLSLVFVLCLDDFSSCFLVLCLSSSSS